MNYSISNGRSSKKKLVFLSISWLEGFCTVAISLIVLSLLAQNPGCVTEATADSQVTWEQ